jgi:hypothetical protein
MDLLFHSLGDHYLLPSRLLSKFQILGCIKAGSTTNIYKKADDGALAQA